MTSSTCVIDNGAYAIKIGLSSSTEPKIVPNCIMKAKSEKRRPFIGNQIEECRDLSGLFYTLPFQKGYLTNLELQKKIWDHIFSNELKIDFKETPIIFTEPYFNFLSIQKAVTELFFEEYKCQALLRINGGELSAYHYFHDTETALCCLLIDSSYSFTYIVPFIKGSKYKPGIVRVDIGGKLLTNHLKDTISYRQIHVMEETHVINEVKEDACFVSQDFNQDMEIAKKQWPENSIVRDYVLPDYVTLRRGYLKTLDTPPVSDYQTIRLSNERFNIPEVLFSPPSVGIYQMGIPEAILRSISLCPEPLQPHLYNNIILTGGCARFPGFRDRIYKDVRAATPAIYDVNVFLPSTNPMTYAWEGGRMLSHDPEFYSHAVTREQYQEEGFPLCRQKFDV